MNTYYEGSYCNALGCAPHAYDICKVITPNMSLDTYPIEI